MILGAASFLSRIMALVRDRVFSHQFGASDVLDMYYAAFRIPDFMYNLIILGALSAGFIPVFIGIYKKNKEQAWEFANHMVGTFGVLLLLVGIALFIFAPSLTTFLAPGFTSEQLALTTTLTRIMVASPILLGLSGIFGGINQSIKCFLAYSSAPIFYNLGIIAGAWLLVPLFGVSGLAYGVVLGAFMHLAIQLPTVFSHGYHFEPKISFRHPDVQTIGRLMLPRTLGLVMIQINFIAMTMMASTMSEGSITVFNFANNLQHVAVGVIGISFALASFPLIAEYASCKQYKNITSHLIKTTKQVLFFIMPASVLLLLLRAQIVRVVFGTGSFDWADTIATADTIAFFALSLFAQALIPLFTRTFFALKDTWTPFVTATIGTALTIALGYVFTVHPTIAPLISTLSQEFLTTTPSHVALIAFAFSIAMVVQFALLWIILHHKLPSFGEKSLLLLLAKISLAAIAMGITVQGLKAPISHLVDMTRLWGIFVQGLVSGSAGIAVYLGVSYILKVESLRLVVERVKR